MSSEVTKPVPKRIKAEEGRVAIVWSDAHESAYEARDLRLACRCAACNPAWGRGTPAPSSRSDGFEVLANGPDGMRKRIEDEVPKWRDIIAKAGIQPV